MMKKTFLLLFALSVFQLTNAQVLSQWRISGVQASFGQDRDMIHSMNHEYFMQTIKGNTQYDYADLNLDKSYAYSMLCENPHLRLALNLDHQSIPKLGMSLSMVGIFNRVDGINYGTPGKSWGDEGYQDLDLDMYTNEIAIEPALSYRLIDGKFSLTGGAGVNAGYVFGGNLNVSGYNLEADNGSLRFNDDGSDLPQYEDTWTYEHLDMRNGFSTRAFVSLAASVTLFQRVELGVNYRHGVGVRMINGADAIGTELSSHGIFAAWKLR